MKKTLLLLALLLSFAVSAQPPDGSFPEWVVAGGRDFKSYYAGTDVLYSRNGAGSFALIAKSTFLTPAQGNTAYQPLSATLTALAALSTTSYGRGFLSLADAAAARTYIGVGTGTGSVTSVAASGSGGILVGGSPITTSGTLTFDLEFEDVMTGLDGISDPPVRTTALASYVQDGQTLSTGLAFPSGGLRVKDNLGSQELGFVVGEDLTANRQLTILVGDADRTLDLTDLLTETQADGLYDPLTPNRPNNITPDLTFHYFPVYDPGDAQSEKTDGVEIKAWLAGEFDALGSASAAQAAAIAASQPIDAELTALASTTSAADKLPYFTGSGTATTTDFTSVARTLVSEPTQALMRTTGLGATTIGGNVFTLTNPSAVTFLRINADNTATARTAEELLSDLGIAKKSGAPVFTNSTTSFTDVTGASITIPAGVTAEITCWMVTRSANANSGVNTSITATNSPTIALTRTQFSAAATSQNNSNITANDGGATITVATDLNTDLPSRITGTITTGGSPSVIQLRLARGGSSANNVTVMSYGILANW